MIFCLGIFVFPKQNFNAQVAQSSCCESQSNNSDCCEKEDASSKSCSHDSKKEKDCKDNCTTCKTCSSGFVFSVVLNNFDNKLRTPIFQIENQYSYYSQSPLARAFIIWQPPKLG
ncbi:hypothetical protein LUD75_06485 [Epilithonimonas sp. JDS]|uniref:hypothetical protein n=1 Tax=Chryseobacterium group TaxID=2782232 RepID=UPI00103EA98B|nr:MULTISPECIES: hypothetical protein [Chryseobacterium group]MCD9854343.1 hypothetical protein [Epilithonimonas sp. JDS]WDF47481.1 hypothetical protein PQ459_03110 [Chryseobacterium sp. KACC 21268]